MPASTIKKPTGYPCCLQALTSIGDLPVWSLIVTVFGDLAQNSGDRISGPVLSAILDPIGVKPEASRVATHRLRKEGWIRSEKSGRSRLHSLTDFGRAQSAEASPRIYEMPEFDEVWHVLLAPPGSHANPDQLVVMPRLMFGNGPPPTKTNALVLEGRVSNVPAWLTTQIESSWIGANYAVLETVLNQVWASLPTKLTPVETAVLRTLIVHHWRRLVLRHPPLPDNFFSDAWRGVACRNAAFRLLDALPRPSLSLLEQNT